MKSVELKPSCNPATVYDGRGGIFTWLPDEPLVEFNMLYFQPSASRGNHFHPHFNEYFLIVDGQGIMEYIDTETQEKGIIHLSKGVCVKNPAGVPHACYAITPLTAVAMLTQPWDKSNPPIIHAKVQ